MLRRSTSTVTAPARIAVATLVATCVLATPLAVAAATAAPSTGSAVAVVGGMDSPEAAVEELIAAVEGSDPLGILAVLHPDERALLESIYLSTNGTTAGSAGIDLGELARSVVIDIEAGPFTVTELDPRVAWVTSPMTLAASVDNQQLTDVLGDQFGDPSDSEAAIEEEFGAGVNGFGVATVREGDRWFVSLGYSLVENALRADDPTRTVTLRSIDAAATPGAETPDAAVAAFLYAAATLDPRQIAETLVPYEAGMILAYAPEYGPALDDLLADNASAIDVELSNISLTMLEPIDGAAVVEVHRLGLDLTVSEDDYTGELGVQVSGLCAKYSATYTGTDPGDVDRDSGGACLFEEPGPADVLSILADPEGWAGARLVAVDTGDGWKVSVLRTAANFAVPFTEDPFTLLSIFAGGSGVGSDLGGPAVGAGALFWLAPQLEPVALGDSTVDPAPHGRVALFALPAEATSVGVTNPSEDCRVFVFVGAADDFDAESGACDGEPVVVPTSTGDGPVGPDASAIVFVTANADSNPYTGLEPIGPSDVTVG